MRILNLPILLLISLNTFAVKPSAISPIVTNLPDGPGSIGGLGQSINALTSNGSVAVSIPVDVPPGVNGLVPDLTINYSSASGSGILGIGFDLRLPTIRKQTDQGLPEYDGNDRYVDEKGIELVHVGSNTYRARYSENFNRYKKLGDNAWIVTLPNGTVYELGKSTNSRVESTGKTFEWKISSVVDPNSNRINFSYKKLDTTNQVYLDQIVYAEQSASTKQSVSFIYEERPDILVDYKSGFEVKTAFRLSKIKTFSIGLPVRSYSLGYHPNDDWNVISQLSSFTINNGDETESLLTKTFKFTSYASHNQQIESIPTAQNMAFGTSDVDFIDANNDGLPDVLNTAPSRDMIWLNKGVSESGQVEFENPKIMSVYSHEKLSMDNVQWSDFDGDGKSNLVSYNANFTAFHHLNDDLDWENTGVIRDINFPLDNTNVRLFDINNDRRTDVVYTAVNSRGQVYAHVTQLNLDTGWTSPIVMDYPSTMGNIRFSDANVRLADMNGDGLQDVVFLMNRNIAYFPGRGLNGFGDLVRFSNSPRDLWSVDAIKLADMNNDGITDLVHINGIRAEIWINKGKVDGDYARFSDQATYVQAPFGLSVQNSTLVDINGNGSTDILWYSPGEYEDTFTFAELYPSEVGNLLKEVSNGIGSVTQFTYTTLISERAEDKNAGNDWNNDVPLAMPILKSIDTFDGLKELPSTTEFDYSNAYFSFVDREFRGFESVNQIEKSEITGQSRVTRTEYDVGEFDKALAGIVKKQEGLTQSGQSFYQDINTWTVRELQQGVNDNRNITYPLLSETVRTISELGVGEPVEVKWEYDYDNYGNLIRLAELGRTNSSWIDERITLNRYSSENAFSLSNWRLNYPIESIVTDVSGMALTKKQWFYDDEAFSNSNLGIIAQGNVTSEVSWIDPSDDSTQINVVRKRYSDKGLVTGIFDPLWAEGQLGHSRTVTYDDHLGIFPKQEIISTTNQILIASTEYNSNYGTMSSFTDFNGASTLFEYDDFGRTVKTAYPGDSLSDPSIEYSYVNHEQTGNAIVNWVHTRQKTDANGGIIESRQFIDGLGRTILEKREGELASQYIVSNQTEYDLLGNPIKTYLPYFSSSVSFNKEESGDKYLEVEFDSLGRAVKEWSPFDDNMARSYSQIQYQPLVELHSDHEQTDSGSVFYGNYKKLYFDGLLGDSSKGRLVQVDDVVKLDEAGEESGIMAWPTYYQYDAVGNFISLLDAQGNKRTMYYDGLGRNYFYNDPNRGYFWNAFDKAGNLIATRDANGTEVHSLYDENNRHTYEYALTPTETTAQVGKIWNPSLDTSNLNPEVVYQYDNVEGVSSGHSLGRLVKVMDNSGYSLYAYDERGRVIEQSRQIQGHGIHTPLYVSKRQYDNAGRITRLEYPDQTFVNYQYNDGGFLSAISGVIDYISYDAAGNQVLREYSNGLTTTYQYDHLMRLSFLETTRDSDALQLQHLTYEFDNLVNIKSIIDGRSEGAINTIALEAGASSESIDQYRHSMNYTYDDFYRLKSASSTLHSYQYRYDLVGNILTKTKNGFNGDAISSVLLYGNSQTENNNGSWNRVGRIKGEVAGPHALTSTNGQAAYFYDDNGNLIQDGNFNYEWDHRNRLKQMTSSSLSTNGQAQ